MISCHFLHEPVGTLLTCIHLGLVDKRLESPFTRQEATTPFPGQALCGNRVRSLLSRERCLWAGPRGSGWEKHTGGGRGWGAPSLTGMTRDLACYIRRSWWEGCGDSTVTGAGLGVTVRSPSGLCESGVP